MKSQAILLALVVVAGAGTVSAQGASTATRTSAAGSATPIVLKDGIPIGAAEPWAARPIGKYDLTIVTPGEMLSGHLTLADSAGKLASSMMVDGQGTMPFEPTVAGNELTLQLKRERGPITIHLFHRGDRLSGSWTVGDEAGTLEGVAAPNTPTVVAAAPSGPAEVWNAKPVGKYQIALAIPGHDMTADVTVREENGKLIANIWPVGDRDGRDFGAAVMESRLVISGTTERGAMNITLEHRGPTITGSWKLGEQSGTLTGEFVK